MSFPDSENPTNSKPPKYFTMDRTPSHETLYLDSEVAREQRIQSETEVEANADQGGQEGVLAGMKHKLDSMATGSSISEFGKSVSAVAQDGAGTVKETVVEGGSAALHAVQDQVRALAGGAKEVEESVSDSLSAESQEDFKHIDKMSDESVSEFLRAKHMSNSHTRPTD